MIDLLSSLEETDTDISLYNEYIKIVPIMHRISLIHKLELSLETTGDILLNRIIVLSRTLLSKHRPYSVSNHISTGLDPSGIVDAEAADGGSRNCGGDCFWD